MHAYKHHGDDPTDRPRICTSLSVVCIAAQSQPQTLNDYITKRSLYIVQVAYKHDSRPFLYWPARLNLVHGKEKSDFCRVQKEGSKILRRCFSQSWNRIQTFETLAEKDKKDTSLSITSMLTALHSLARLIDEIECTRRCNIPNVPLTHVNGIDLVMGPTRGESKCQLIIITCTIYIVLSTNWK